MRSLLIALLALVTGTVFSAEGGYKLFPVSGVFQAKGLLDSKSLIDPDFSIAIPGSKGGAIFVEKFRKIFPDAETTIEDANKRRTFAASLQIARASKYLISKPDGTTDVYLPITASIYFTNLMTGEVLFTLTRTEIKIATLKSDATNSGSEKIRELYRESFDGIVDTLVNASKVQFKPTIISTVVRGEWKGLFILDGGRDQGISRDSSLINPQGAELLVISSGPNYSIAKNQTNTPIVKGGVFSKVSNQTLAEIKKPRVLPIVANHPAGLPEQSVVQLLSDALGSKSLVSIIPVNNTFQTVLNSVSGQVKVSEDSIRKRELPNFFFRLNIPEPIEYEISTNLAHKTKHIYQAIAIAELVDRSGQVLYAGIGKDRIEDDVTAGISFSVEARKEIVVKNALIDLANKFGNEMKFSNSEISVSIGGKDLSIIDHHAMLSKGSNQTVYHSIGKVEGIGSEVRVPIWEIRVTDINGEKVNAVLDMPVVQGAPEPVAGDVVFLNGVAGDGFITRKTFGACPTQKLGSIDIPNYGDMAQNIFATRFKAAYFIQGLGPKVEELVRSGSGFKADLKMPDMKVDYCVEPVHRIDPNDPKCVDDACADVAAVRLTYRIRNGSPSGEIKIRQGLETKLTANTVPKVTGQSVKATVLRADLLNEILKLNSEIIPGLLKETY